MLFFLIKDWEGCDRDLTILINAGVQDPEIYRIRSRCLVQSQHYENALEDANTYVRLERGSARSRLNRAEILGDLEMPEAAEEDFLVALTKDEQDVLKLQPNVYWIIAKYKLDKGEYDESLKFLEKYQSLHKNQLLSPHFYATRSRIYLSKGFTKEAIMECNRALTMETNPDFLGQMGKALGEDGQFEEALVYFDKALKLDQKGKMREFLIKERQATIEKYALLA